MKIFFSAAFAFVCSLLLSACQSAETNTTEDAKLAVSWELLTNFTDVPTGFEARFTLTNNSDETLTDKNWKLFFNMAPRPILTNKTPQPATVQHINGDWYKLVPEKGFSLKPGASVEIHYTGTEGIIKETDAPLGLYVVYYDDAGKEQRIAQVSTLSLIHI